MKVIDVPIIGDSDEVAQDNPQFTLNMYAEKVSDDVLTLKPTPGTVLHSQLIIGGGGRGIILVGTRLFAVRGSYFQEYTGGAWVSLGTLASSQGKIALISNLPPNGNGQVLIVDASAGYVFKLIDNSFTTLLLANGFNGGNSKAAFCAGRAIVFKPGSLQWQCSALYDFTTWSGLDTGTKTSISLVGEIKSIASNGDLLYLWSSSGFEVWQDNGDGTGSPFTRILSGDTVGILAPDSALVSQRYFYWLGATSEGNGVVWRHSGGGLPQRISNHSTERQIAALPTPSDAIGLTYQSLGHIFYLLNFTAGNKTTVFDAVTGLWADRSQRDSNSGAENGLPFIGSVVLDGVLLALDQRDGKVWKVDDKTYTDDGNPIVRERILPPVPDEADALSYFQSVELFAEIGNTPAGQDDPQIMFQYSLDRGKTWSQEDWQQAGGNGSYEARTRWVGLGAGYCLVPRFRISASQYVSWRKVRLRAE